MNYAKQFFYLILLIGCCGCASQHGLINLNVMVAEKAPTTVITQADVPTVQVTPEPKESYTVVKGDCLWSIAGKKEVYWNSFMWPVLWKENRIQIVDPDKIEVGQVLKVRRHADDTKIVLDFASAWPKYKKH